MLNYPMIRRTVLRVLNRKFVSLTSLAEETIEIYPEEKVSLPKAIFLKGALDKIKGISEWRYWEQEEELIHGRDIIAHPIHAYFMEDVDIVGAYVYCGPAKDMPGYGPEKIILRNYPDREFIHQANLVTSYAGSLFFGPLLVDDFPLELYTDHPENNIKMVTNKYEDEDEYRKLLDIQDTRLVKHARVKQLTMYSQPAINTLRTQNYKILRQRLHDKFTASNVSSSPGIYLKRGATGEKRLLTNEPELENFLVKLGFDIVEPAKMTVREIVERTLGAKIVISVEGSQLSHIIFSMHEKGAFVVLQPPDRFSMVYKEFADCMGMKFAFIVGDSDEGGFKIQTDELGRIIDLL